MKSIFFTFFTALLVLLTQAFPASAEVTCYLPVSYEWARDNDPAQVKTVSPQPEKIVEFVRRLTATGENEIVIKRDLTQQAELLKRDILRECKAVHENYSGCIASRYRAFSSDLRSSGFEVRKSLNEAIAEDCRAVKGTCVAVNIPEPQCSSSEAPVDAQKDDKQPEKEKKKKK